VITADYNPDALRIDRSDLRDRLIQRQPQLELFAAATSAVSGEI
jgi:hypothetical protein